MTHLMLVAPVESIARLGVYPYFPVFSIKNCPLPTYPSPSLFFSFPLDTATGSLWPGFMRHSGHQRDLIIPKFTRSWSPTEEMHLHQCSSAMGIGRAWELCGCQASVVIQRERTELIKDGWFFLNVFLPPYIQHCVYREHYIERTIRLNWG